MYVTSDLFDLVRVGRFCDVDWRENLVGGVAVHGTNSRGYEALAAFLLEAAKRCGVLDDMQYAGYDRPGDRSTRPLTPKSFERLARGELAGAKTAVSVLFRGSRDAVGCRLGNIMVGGEGSDSERRVRGPTGSVSVENYPFRAFDIDFIFPLQNQSADIASDIFRLAIDVLGAEYGYYFVRDDLCSPFTYAHGIGSGIHYGRPGDADTKEISDWCDYFCAGQLWTEDWPRFRDLFQFNLLSERHTSKPIEGLGYLHEWISAEPGRGRLEDVGHGRWIWSLTDAEMFNVRPVLNEAGLLVSCRDRVYRDLPETAVNKQPPPRWMP